MRSGALGICIRPANGSLISRIRNSAADADSAKTTRAAISVGLRRANRLKLAKMTASQNTSTAKNGIGIELPACTNSAKRVCTRSVDAWIARSLRERWASVCGVSSPTLAKASCETLVAANGVLADAAGIEKNDVGLRRFVD